MNGISGSLNEMGNPPILPFLLFKDIDDGTFWGNYNAGVEAQKYEDMDTEAAAAAAENAAEEVDFPEGTEGLG